MKRMRIKRVLSAVLSLALLAALTAVPGSAAGSSFSDVADQATAVNADVLRLMGVVDGVGNNSFNPNANLTRAEFCAMVVKFMQKGDLVPLHATRTIFTDVTSRHWGLGYVNLAASLTVKDGEKEVPLISGVGDGRFEPDAKITLAQAATILIRVLGYSSQQAGAVWPESYMNLASSIGLTDGIAAGSDDNITRAQAAQLFVNALTCKTGEGGDYYKSLGTAKENVVVLAVNVTSEDGSAEGAVRTSDGTYLPKTESAKPTGLQGRRGALVINDKQEIVTFVPDDSQSTTITLSGDAQPTYLRGSNGVQYVISSDTKVYTSDKSEGDSYVNAHTSLRSGSQVTLFSQRGKVVAVYVAGSMTTSDAGAVVVTGPVNAATFYKLTGGATNFQIQKNRQNISLSDIKTNDVVTYDSLSNTLIVSDLRLTCMLEEAYPSPKAPEKITVLGTELPVLQSAWDNTADVSVGGQVALLLTADGKVAGMVKPTAATRSNAIGMVTDGQAEVFLPNGGVLTLKGSVSGADRVKDQLVTISSSSKGVISASRLTTRTTNSPLDLKTMKLGSYIVTAGVRIYEQTGDGAMAPVALGTLGYGQISGENIATYHLNSADMVDYIVLNDVTGNAYEYGMMVADSKTQTVTEEGPDGETIEVDKTTQTWKLVRGTGTLNFSAQSGYAGKSGQFVGVSIGRNSKGEPTIRSVKELTAIKNVKPTDFFESGGLNYVSVGTKTYLVSDQVECYRSVSSNRYSQDNWFSQATGQERLDACKAYSQNLTLYVDPVGQQVRIIQAD